MVHGVSGQPARRPVIERSSERHAKITSVPTSETTPAVSPATGGAVEPRRGWSRSRPQPARAHGRKTQGRGDEQERDDAKDWLAARARVISRTGRHTQTEFGGKGKKAGTGSTSTRSSDK
ncbi:hypothetical protein GUJ93_ZPchr0007g3224 [Zizania palustris]|uniref:Uncharacterized protein n=1 Tax=Zizania palustris TaxID=103762 RepID=A0A8J5SK40_ZIZPA|nr:hypothetical protein GUJ93_ZPchr0007g3224 [Zizania palustris]